MLCDGIALFLKCVHYIKNGGKNFLELQTPDCPNKSYV